MSLESKRLEECTAVAAETDTGFEVMDEWLRLENEHTDPGFILPSQADVVAWCERHPGVIVVSANTLLWGPVIWAMCQG
jgi:hypothetical protein